MDSCGSAIEHAVGLRFLHNAIRSNATVPANAASVRYHTLQKG